MPFLLENKMNFQNNMHSFGHHRVQHKLAADFHVQKLKRLKIKYDTQFTDSLRLGNIEELKPENLLEKLKQESSHN